MERLGRPRAVLVVVLAAGLYLRLVGFDRGGSDLVPLADRQRGWTSSFHTFHPDEATVVQAALRPVDLLDPPFTAYGTLPAYLLHAVLETAASLGDWGPLELESPASRRRVFLTARSLAIAFSGGVLLLTWWLGRRLVGPWAGVAATAVVALAPGAQQQAHFYIVDGLFAFFSLATVCLILRAAERPDAWPRWLAVGALVGLAMSVRQNGGLLGIAAAAALVLIPRPRLGWVRALTWRPLWGAGAVAAAIVGVLHAFLFYSPERLTAATGIGDVALALSFSSLRVLQPFTLVDVHATPFVGHWLGLWPLICGWPLTLVFLAGLAWALWQRDARIRVLALWVLLYFLPVGALKVRAVRHLVPLLAPLALLAAGLADAAWRRARQARLRSAGLGLGLLLFAHLCAYGIGFARIYREQDSRIQAARFLARHTEPGVSVGVENGAFTVAHLVDPQRNPRLWLDVPPLFYAGPYMLCADRVDYLRQVVAPMRLIALADVNRAAQFAAVPELFPVVADFYARLLAGRLGFEPVRRFKTYPRFAGLVFRDDGAEPSFLGYDHPAVHLLLRSQDVALEPCFEAWSREVARGDACGDVALADAARRLAAGDAAGADAILTPTLAAHPGFLLGHRLHAEALRRLGRGPEAEAAMARFRPQTAGGRMAHVDSDGAIFFVAPWTAASLVRLGLPRLAVAVLAEGVADGRAYAVAQAQLRAAAYLGVAERLEGAGEHSLADSSVTLSLQVCPTTSALNRVARCAAEAGDSGRALELLQRSLLLDPRQGAVHLQAAQLCARRGDDDLARYHLAQAVALDPELRDSAATVVGGG